MTDQQIASHIFVSHSSAEAAFVQRLATDLQSVGIPIWVDQQKLKPGTRNWEKAIREALKQSPTLIYVASPTAAQSDYVQDELSIAEMEGCRLLAAWAVGEDKRWLDCTPLGYGKLQYTDMRGEKYEAGLKELIEALNRVVSRPISLMLRLPVEDERNETDDYLSSAPKKHEQSDVIIPRNPYKALDAFTEADAKDFYGRDDLIAALLKRLSDFPSFLTVIGASGSGKSSVVMAGLIPSLRRTHPDWIILPPVKPGGHPIEALAIVLHHAYFAQGSINAVREDLDSSDSRGLLLRAAAIPRQAKARVILLVDQFEEVFTQTTSEQEREQFINILTSAANDPGSNVTIILTLRADFFDRPLSDSELGKLIQEHSESVLPMSITDLKQTIEKPAEQTGLSFEEGLVSDIVFDTRGQVGGLPLLQYTLEQLFQKREDTSLTHRAYKEIGGVKGALGGRAEETYNALETDDHRRLTRALFLRLIEPGTTERDTSRRRAALTELDLPDPEQTKIIQQCADTFVNARLLTTDEMSGMKTIEVSHEALIREWKRLGEWLHESRVDVRLQQRLTADATEWQQRGKPIDLLYRGTVLREAQRWTLANKPSAREMAFIEASAYQQKEFDRLNESRKAHEAMLELRSRRALQVLVFVLVLATISAFVLTGFIANERQNAVDARGTSDVNAANALNARETSDSNVTQAIAAQSTAERVAAESQSLALASGSGDALRDSQYDYALALAVQANLLPNPPLPARSALVNAALFSGVHRRLFGHTGYVGSIAMSPDGRYALSGSDDATLRLWNIETGETLFTMSGHTDTVTGVAISPDSIQAVSSSRDRTVRLWDLSTGQLIRTMNDHTDAVTDVAFSPDGQTVLSSSSDQTLILWDLSTGNPHQIVRGHTDAVNSVAFSRDGNLFASGASDGEVIVWNRTGEIIQSIDINPDAVRWAPFVVTAVALSPNNEYIAVGTGGSALMLFGVETGDLVRNFRLYQGISYPGSSGGVTFNSDGTRLISLLGGQLEVYDVESGTVLASFTSPVDMSRIALTVDGRNALSGARTSSVIVWDIDVGEVRTIVEPNIGSSSTGIFNLDGMHALIGGNYTGLALLDTTKGSLTETQTNGIDGIISDLAISADSRIALSAVYRPFEVYDPAKDRAVTVWDMTTGESVRVLKGLQDWAYSVALSPDGRYALAGTGNDIILWDIHNERPLRTFTGHDGGVNDIVFSPDGTLVLSGYSDSTLVLWDVASGQLLRTFIGHTEGVISVAFSPDGLLALSGSDDNTLVLWDVTSGQLLRTFSGHTNRIKEVSFGPDGSLASSISYDGTLILWDVASGSPLRRFSAGGQYMASVILDDHHLLALDNYELYNQSTYKTEISSVVLWELSPYPMEAVAWVQNNRYVPDLTCTQKLTYQIQPLCDAEGL